MNFLIQTILMLGIAELAVNQVFTAHHFNRGSIITSFSILLKIQRGPDWCSYLSAFDVSHSVMYMNVHVMHDIYDWKMYSYCSNSWFNSFTSNSVARNSNQLETSFIVDSYSKYLKFVIFFLRMQLNEVELHKQTNS